MTHLGVAHLTAIDLDPPSFIRAAARAGFDGVGLRLLRVTDTSPGYPLMEDARMMRQTRDALDDTGLSASDIEFVMIRPGMNLDALNGMMDAGATLGARHLITAPYDPDHSRLADTLSRIGELCASRNISPVLEFFPWTTVPDLKTAWGIIAPLAPNIGILADSLHFDRSGSDLDLLRGLPATRVPFAHLCDALVTPPYDNDTLLHTAREERLPPGAGQIDLAGFVGALAPETPLVVEIPMTTMGRSEGADAVLSHVHDMTRKWMHDHCFALT